MSAVASDGWSAMSRPLERTLGKRTANALATLGLDTVEDLLFHVPFRLSHRGELVPINNARAGETVTIVAQVLDAVLRPMNARRGFILTVRVGEGLHELDMTFFAKSPRPLEYHQRRLEVGAVARFSGTVSEYRGRLQLSHPEYELVEDEVDAEEIARPIPIYHATEKVTSWQVAKAVTTVLAGLTPTDVPDSLPSAYREQYALPSAWEALVAIHQPRSDEEWERAQARLVHEEALVLQVALAQRARAARETPVRAFPGAGDGLLAEFDAALPYDLTAGQQAVGEEISRDLASTTPMKRLLQGDVGSGKTVVALRAMLQVADGGGQAALLAPTEVLAVQHVQTIRSLLGPVAPVELITGSMTAAERRRALARVASGQAALVVGTHALLSEDVQIPFLGLLVIDEQHRFGVDQRGLIAASHTLVMTATPIPRTIAMSVFGDLDISTLRELPGGRAGVSTTVVPKANATWMARVWERAAEEVRTGGRVYVVCPRIDETDSSELASVEATDATLEATAALAGIRRVTMHGRLTPEEKTEAMSAFASGDAPILVSTTVIEVGVDVPQATAMVIVDADRFGLSQLHQLRGRVGRGSAPGLCLAITGAEQGSSAWERLEAFASTTDGFELAERDLELRREGDVLGSAQSGRGSHLRFLEVTRHRAVIEDARTFARSLVARDPSLATEPELRDAVQRLDTDRTDYMERG